MSGDLCRFFSRSAIYDLVNPQMSLCVCVVHCCCNTLSTHVARYIYDKYKYLYSVILWLYAVTTVVPVPMSNRGINTYGNERTDNTMVIIAWYLMVSPSPTATDEARQWLSWLVDWFDAQQSKDIFYFFSVKTVLYMYYSIVLRHTLQCVAYFSNMIIPLL